MVKKRTRRTKGSPDYVNNKEFTQAVHDYVLLCNKIEEDGGEVPMITDYITTCIINISSGLSKNSNFNGYPFLEDMVSDGRQDCIKGIRNYNINAATRTGSPNAFGYFTQICFYAFLRRIQKEKKQLNIKEKYRDQSGVDVFADCSVANGMMSEGMAESLKTKMNFYREDLSFDNMKQTPDE